MAEVIKVYRQSVPAVRFIGKKYGEEDGAGGGFGRQWETWFANNWFEPLEKSFDRTSFYEDSDAYIGLMRWKDGEPFEYWIGMFCPEGTAVPEGYGHHDFPASDLGVVWLYGKDGEVYGQEGKCSESCSKEGFKIITDGQGACWFFERYGCPRFTTPDEKGNIILDVCHYIEKV